MLPDCVQRLLKDFGCVALEDGGPGVVGGAVEAQAPAGKEDAVK